MRMTRIALLLFYWFAEWSNYWNGSSTFILFFKSFVALWTWWSTIKKKKIKHIIIRTQCRRHKSNHCIILWMISFFFPHPDVLQMPGTCGAIGISDEHSTFIFSAFRCFFSSLYCAQLYCALSTFVLFVSNTLHASFFSPRNSFGLVLRSLQSRYLCL